MGEESFFIKKKRMGLIPEMSMRRHYVVHKHKYDIKKMVHSDVDLT
jgi:hypothetical protein